MIISNILFHYPDKYAYACQIMWPNFLIENYCHSNYAFNLSLLNFGTSKNSTLCSCDPSTQEPEKSIAYIFSVIKVNFRQNDHCAVLTLAFKELQLLF